MPSLLPLRVTIIFLISLFHLTILAQTEKQYNQIIEDVKLLEKEGRFEDALNFLVENLEKVSPEQRSKLYFKIGGLHFKLKQADATLKAYERAYEFAVLAENKELQSRILINSGAIYSQTGHHLQAIEKFKAAIQVLKSLQNDTLLASIQYNLALSYKEIGANDKAISSALEALENFKTLQNRAYQAKCYQTIGNIHRENQKDSLSLYFHNKALDYYTKQENKKAIASVLNDMGNTYKQLMDYGEALNYYRKSMIVGDSAFKPLTFGNMAEVYQRMGDYKNAEKYYLKAIKLRDASGDLKAFAYAITELGGLYVELKRYSRAKEYLKEAAKIAQVQEYLDIQLKAFELQWQLHENQGNLDTAYLFLRALSELKDQVNARDRQEIIEQKTAEFGLSELQVTVADLSEENEIISLLAREERKAKFTYLIIAILVTVIAIILARNAQKSKKHARWEQAQKIEVQHRVKNFLQTLVNLVYFQQKTTGNSEALAAILQTQNRLSAMLEIHKSLEITDSGQVNFTAYLKNIVNHIKLSFIEVVPTLEISWEVDELTLNADEIIPLGLIINELVTNAFKYGLQNQAQPRLTISMSHEVSTLRLSIVDNGPGISEDTEETKGLKLVKLFAQQLHGKVYFKNEKGTKAMVKVKIKPAA